MTLPKTSYECPACDKGLVTVEEPPAIIHKCDDCVERMVIVDDERWDDTDASKNDD
jgi:ribosomal protein L37AE/L43A